MQVQCVLCDYIETLDDHSFEAKRLRNRRIHMHICKECNDRIDYKTKQRHATGNFRVYKEKQLKNQLI